MKKYVSLLLAVVMTMSLFCACENKGETRPITKKAENSAVSVNNEADKNTVSTEKAEKIASFECGERTVAIAESGTLYYQDANEKYGLLDKTGEKITEAKYTFLEEKENFFQVSESNKEKKEIADLNAYGIIDADGKEILPQKYASFNVLNERYIQAYEVTKSTDDEDKALVYFHEGYGVVLGPSDGDQLYLGNWYIYDVTTGKMLENVSGTNKYSITANANWIEYYTDDKKSITVNEKGEKLPEDANLYENGYYHTENAVYDNNGKEVFKYERGEYSPYAVYGDYFVASKYADDYKYCVMDLNGKVVSAEFNEMISIEGDFVICEDKVYNFDGTSVIDGTFERIYFDKYGKNTYVLKNGDDCKFINKDGEVLLEVTEGDEYYADYYGSFTAYKKTDDGVLYYSFADKDYTINGGEFAPWLVKTDNDSGSSIVDTRTGKTLISNYEAFDYAITDGVIYIYALTEENVIDVYNFKY